jgi:hypothetical protein
MPSGKWYEPRPKAEMRALIVTAELASPVVGDHTCPIDGLLWFVAMREQYGEQIFTESGQDHSQRLPGAQLLIGRKDGHLPTWYHAASFALWPRGAVRGMTHWNQRFDIPLMGLTTASRVEVKSGRYKAYHMPIWYCHAPEVSWRIVAEPRWIARLLPFAHSLGKKRAHGWGHVSRWRVEDAGPAKAVRKDWAVRDDDGNPLRAIPVADGRSGGGILHGYRPSYWLPQNQAICEVPRG